MRRTKPDAMRAEQPYQSDPGRSTAAAVETLTASLRTLEAMHAWRPPLGLTPHAVVPELTQSYGAEGELMRLVANLLYRRVECQAAVRELDLIGAVLQRCRDDERNPLLREWALLAVRNMCEDCAENQAVIAGIKRVRAPSV